MCIYWRNKGQTSPIVNLFTIQVVHVKMHCFLQLKVIFKIYLALHGALTNQSRHHLKCGRRFWEALAVFCPWGLWMYLGQAGAVKRQWRGSQGRVYLPMDTDLRQNVNNWCGHVCWQSGNMPSHLMIFTQISETCFSFFLLLWPTLGSCYIPERLRQSVVK